MKKPIFENEGEVIEFLSETLPGGMSIVCDGITRTELMIENMRTYDYIKKSAFEEAEEEYIKYIEYLKTYEDIPHRKIDIINNYVTELKTEIERLKNDNS